MCRCALFLLAALVFSAGCNNSNQKLSIRHQPSTENLLSKEELHEKLHQFEDTFEANIRRVCEELVMANPTRRVKRLTLIWQMRILPMARNALDQENPLGALLDAWTLCIRLDNYLRKGEGRNFFGEHQDMALSAVWESEREIAHIATLVMPPDVLKRTSEKMQEVAANNPIRGEFSGADVRAALQKQDQDAVLQTVLSLPLVPFRWLGGVDETAQAIKGFTIVAGRLTDVVHGLAADARLQTQLLLLEVEDLDTVKSALKSLETFSESSKRFADTAEKLPEKLRTGIAGTLDDIDERRDKLRSTIDETKALVERIEATASKTAKAGDAWTGTAKAIKDMVVSFKQIEEENEVPADAAGNPMPGATTVPVSTALATTGPVTTAPVQNKVPPNAKEEEEESPPFDINDYRRTAEALTVTAKELQKLAGDLEKLGKSDDLTQNVEKLSKQVQALLAQSSETAQGVTDHAAWRGVQIVALIFALLIVYRLVAGRYLTSNAAKKIKKTSP